MRVAGIQRDPGEAALRQRHHHAGRARRDRVQHRRAQDRNDHVRGPARPGGAPAHPAAHRLARVAAARRRSRAAASRRSRRARRATSSSISRATRSSSRRAGSSSSSGCSCSTGAEPRYQPFWAHDRDGERRAFEDLVDLIHARLGRASRPARLPLQRLGAEHAQAAHGRARHARGAGGRPAPAQGLRGSAHDRAPGPARGRAQLLAQGRRGALRLHPERPPCSRARRPSSTTSAGSISATRRCWTRSRPTTRRTVAPRWVCSTGCTGSARPTCPGRSRRRRMRSRPRPPRPWTAGSGSARS